MAPAKPKDKSLAELINTLHTHFEPKSLIIAERFYFNQRNQLPNESITDYMAVLCKMATHCSFKDFLDEALCDCFVSGLHSTNIQKRLLLEELTCAGALQMAQSMESAQTNTTKLQGGETPSVNYNSTPSHRERGARLPSGKQYKSKPCYRCGGKCLLSNCRFVEFICNKCHKKGHIARACMSSTQGRHGEKTPGKQPRPPQQATKANIIHGSNPDTEGDESDSLPLLRVGGQARQPIVVKLTVDGKSVPMEVDTGAAISVISSVTKEQLFPQKDLLETTLVLTTYTGE